MENNKPIIIEGGSFKDERGRIDFINDFNLTEVKRMYFTTNESVNQFRAWQGHKIESRWFFCTEGTFEVKLIQIDDWENPSNELTPIKYILSSEKPQVLFIPPGYVNGFRALKKKSKLLILSNFEIGVNEYDDVRYNSSRWH